MPEFQHVFVLCTGRCGSTTFTRACQHMTNWTAGHETRTHLLHPERLVYPAGHIEADNRLSWHLGLLDRMYGNSAAYVHLVRNPAHVAMSYARRWPNGIMGAYENGVMQYVPALHGEAPERSVLAVAQDLVETTTANIELFLQGKRHVLQFWIEEAASQWPGFWDWLDAEGDFEAALAEFSVKHNAS